MVLKMYMRCLYVFHNVVEKYVEYVEKYVI